MPRWCVDLFHKVLATLGAVEARDEREAIKQAAKEFNIRLALRNKIVVTRLDDSNGTRLAR